MLTHGMAEHSGKEPPSTNHGSRLDKVSTITLIDAVDQGQASSGQLHQEHTYSLRQRRQSPGRSATSTSQTDYHSQSGNCLTLRSRASLGPLVWHVLAWLSVTVGVVPGQKQPRPRLIVDGISMHCDLTYSRQSRSEYILQWVSNVAKLQGSVQTSHAHRLVEAGTGFGDTIVWCDGIFFPCMLV